LSLPPAARAPCSSQCANRTGANGALVCDANEFSGVADARLQTAAALAF
jgi:hypothetical protein